MSANNQDLPKGRFNYILIGGALLGLVMAVISLLMTPGTGGKPISLGSFSSPLEIGKAAPEFTGRTIYGKELTLSNLHGSIIALNFWATWCAPCKVEMPELESAAYRYSDQKLEVIAVNAGENSNIVAAYMNDLKLDFTVVLDLDGKIVQQYEIAAFPTTFWIDADGIIRAKHLGPLTTEDIDRYVTDMIQRNP
jgi:cytochrome c biogenesis protein CcmG, thiol:disulfide interchange protein DsbE